MPRSGAIPDKIGYTKKGTSKSKRRKKLSREQEMTDEHPTAVGVERSAVCGSAVSMQEREYENRCC